MTIESEALRQMPSIRAATPNDAALIAGVHVASWRETYAGLLPEAMLSDLSVSDRTGRWARIFGKASHPSGATTSPRDASTNDEVVRSSARKLTAVTPSP